MKDLPRVARYTNRLHIQAAMLEGVLAGVLTTRDIVAEKSFGASQMALVLITMAPSLCSALAIFIAPYADGFNRRRLFIYSGLFGRLTLLGVGVVIAPHMLPLFIALNVMHELAQVVVIPAQNTLYQNNYHSSHRARLFGRASTYQGLVTALTSLVAGALLDAFPEAHRFLYPTAGIAGMASCVIFARIRVRRMVVTVPLHTTIVGDPAPPAVAPTHSVWRTIREVLVVDRAFRNFEIAFFLYGLGFMMMQPVFAPFFVQELGLDYKEATLAKSVVFHLAFIGLLPLAARVCDRTSIPHLALVSFALLVAFAFSLVLVSGLWSLLFSFVLFGMAMSGVSIAWNLGPTHFARGGSSARYMSVHYSLVGVRAAIGFPLGGAVAIWQGPRATFIASMALFLAAILVMGRLARAETRASTADDARSSPHP